MLIQVDLRINWVMKKGGPEVHLSDQAIRSLATQRSSELIAEAERLNRLHDARRHRRRRHTRSLLNRRNRGRDG
jgi:hypothetical protein